MHLMILLFLVTALPAAAQTTGLCSAIADRAARLACLNQPLDRPLAPAPAAAPAPTARPPAPARRACTTAAPCTDARGAYFTAHDGSRRYLRQR